MVLKERWEKEYKKRGIPSSFRDDPARSLTECLTWLKEEGKFVKGHAADIGCGRGRNSLFLAREGFSVTSFDLLEENAKSLNQEAKRSGFPIQASSLDVSEPWPLSDASCDLIIDIFCYKHLVDKAKQRSYRNELNRTLKPSGFYFISLASEKDGYYGPLLRDNEEKKIVDPHCTIASYLYSIDDLTKEFSDLFEVVKIQEDLSESPMHGKIYPRVVINAIFQKKELL